MWPSSSRGTTPRGTTPEIRRVEVQPAELSVGGSPGAASSSGRGGASSLGVPSSPSVASRSPTPSSRSMVSVPRPGLPRSPDKSPQRSGVGEAAAGGRNMGPRGAAIALERGTSTPSTPAAGAMVLASQPGAVCLGASEGAAADVSGISSIGLSPSADASAIDARGASAIDASGASGASSSGRAAPETGGSPRRRRAKQMVVEGLVTMEKETSEFLGHWFGASRFEHRGLPGALPKLPGQGAPSPMGSGAATPSQSAAGAMVAVRPRGLPPEGWALPALPGPSGFPGLPGYLEAGQQPLRPQGNFQVARQVPRAVGEHWEMQEELVRQNIPVFVLVQVAVTVGLWLFFWRRDGAQEAGLESIWPGKTDLIVQWDCQDKRSEFWRWFTYQYTHVGPRHVGVNAFMVLFMGVPLEGFHGTLLLAFMFNVGVFGGACCYFVSDLHTRVVGMSGGCYALLGMHLADVVMNWAEKAYSKQKLIFLIVVAAADLISAYFTLGSGTSHSAHLGGYVAGLLIGILAGRNLVTLGCERGLKAIALIIAGMLVVFSVGWGMMFPPQEIWEQVRWCWGRQVANSTIFGDNDYHCVRCSNDACIQRWSQQVWISEVSSRICSQNGGYDVTDG